MCSSVICPLGQVCNVNTGQCIEIPQAYFERSQCDAVHCPGGSHCDGGRCVPTVKPVYNQAPCLKLTCAPGQTCDPTRNRCVNYKLRFMKPSRRLKQLHYYRSAAPTIATPMDISCYNISCPLGYQCNTFTKRCIQFRSLDSDLCLHVNCPKGYQCNMASGICSLVLPQNTDSCYGVECPRGTACDTATGNCVIFRLPHNTVDYCFGTTCPNGGICDPTTGRCIPPSTLIMQETIARNPCASVNCPFGVCDPQTGRCAQYKWTQISPPSVIQKSLCDGTVCPQDTACDDTTGNCVQYKTQGSRGLHKKGFCIDVKCPQGTSCDTNTGICRLFCISYLFFILRKALCQTVLVLNTQSKVT